MSLTPATFYNDLADGPQGGQAWWATTEDGVRIRIGGWHADDAKGTVLLFNGRSEYIEKYGRNAADFLSHGYNLLSLDWRGQGLADRQTKDPNAGHVCDFEDYQKDVRALMANAKEAGFDGPYFLIGHSMGGGIGYHALADGLPVKAAAFSGPMWGLTVPLVFRPFARLIARTAVAFGRGHDYILTGKPESYLIYQDFDGNELTNDPDMYAYLRKQVENVPGFALGGPTMKWLAKAFEEMEFIQTSEPPKVPVKAYVGTEEEIVHPDKIKDRIARWPGAEVVEYEGGRHEMLMDTPELRGRMTDDILQFFEQHRAA